MSTPTIVVVVRSYSTSFSKDTPKIDFDYSDELHLYVVSSLSPFKQYVSNILTTNPDQKKVFITDFCGYEDYFATMQFVSSLVDRETIVKTSNSIFPVAHAYYNKNDNSSTFEPGQFEFPLPFELITLCPDSQFHNLLSHASIQAQQILRVITLAHGGLLVCMDSDEIKKRLSSVDGLKILLSQIFYGKSVNDVTTFPQPIPVFDTKTSIRLLFPAGWDSWSKIKLLTTSKIYQESTQRLLRKDEDFQELLDLYGQVIQSDESLQEKMFLQLLSYLSSQSQTISTQDTSNEEIATSKTLSDFLKEITT